MPERYNVGAELRWPAVIVALISVCLYTVASYSDRQSDAPLMREKLAVSRKLVAAEMVLRDERKKLKIPITIDDRERTGWIGGPLSWYTTEPGSVTAKRSSANPNFGAVAVEMLSHAGVRKGDAVALGMSGSVPALNTAMIAAAEELGAYPIIISSVGASQYGANQDRLTWQRMEKAFRERGIISHGSVAVSRGGSSSTEQRVLDRLDREAARSDVEVIDDNHLGKSVQRRMAIYRQQAGKRRIAVFVNIGGAAVNVGAPQIVDAPDSFAAQGVLGVMKSQGVRVIDVRLIKTLCQRYGLPWDPSPLPAVGQGGIYHTSHRSPVVVGLCLLALAGAICYTAARKSRWSERSPIALGDPIHPQKP